MDSASFTKSYPCSAYLLGNFGAHVRLEFARAAVNYGTTVSLLRSRLSRLALGAIPERFSSSLPPLFASGRFATFLYSAR